MNTSHDHENHEHELCDDTCSHHETRSTETEDVAPYASESPTLELHDWAKPGYTEEHGDIPSPPSCITPTTPDRYITEDEALYRSRGESHRRLMRRHKPAITEERLEELRAINKAGRLRPEDGPLLRLANRFGVFIDRDLQHLNDAEDKRQRRAERNRRMWYRDK